MLRIYLVLWNAWCDCTLRPSVMDHSEQKCNVHVQWKNLLIHSLVPDNFKIWMFHEKSGRVWEIKSHKKKWEGSRKKITRREWVSDLNETSLLPSRKLEHCFIWADLSLHFVVCNKKHEFFTKTHSIVEWAKDDHLRGCTGLSMVVTSQVRPSSVSHDKLKTWEWPGDEATLSIHAGTSAIRFVCWITLFYSICYL